jgi:hypothetical protein
VGADDLQTGELPDSGGLPHSHSARLALLRCVFASFGRGTTLAVLNGMVIKLVPLAPGETVGWPRWTSATV